MNWLWLKGFHIIFPEINHFFLPNAVPKYIKIKRLRSLFGRLSDNIFPKQQSEIKKPPQEVCSSSGWGLILSLGCSCHVNLDFVHLSSSHQCWINGHVKTIKLRVNCQKRSLVSFLDPGLVELLSQLEECLEIPQGPFTVPSQ